MTDLEFQMRAWEFRKALVYGVARAKRDFPTIPAQEGAERMAEELLQVFDFWFPDAKVFTPGKEPTK